MIRILAVLILAGCAAQEVPELPTYTGADFAWVHYYGYGVSPAWECRETALNSTICKEAWR
jgi:hypothetical protein